MTLPTSEFLSRVFAISPDLKNIGSCFAYPSNGFFLFITAAHVISNMKHGMENVLNVWKEEKWEAIKVLPYLEPNNDIAIIKTFIPSIPEETVIELSAGHLIIGQEIYFLGFPYFDLIAHKGEKINSGFPIPFVKKAVVSALQHPFIFLDGHNNPGFSGGPIIFWDYEKKKNKVGGIINGYIDQSGKIINERESDAMYYKENSGIAIATNIRIVTEFIKNNNL